MIKDLQDGESYKEGVAFFRLFQTDINVFIDDGVDLAYAEKCVDAMNALSSETIENLCNSSIRYCEWIIENSEDVYEDGDEIIIIPENIKSRDILEFIKPSVMIIYQPLDHSIAAFSMELNCDWEPEHGMEWVIKDEKILYVGSFDGISPWWEDLSCYDIGNYAQ
jgi:hypothetical protein